MEFNLASVGKYVTVALFGCLSGLACISQSLPSIQTDRPDQTESPFIVPAKHLQVELGFLYEQTDKETHELNHPSVLLKYGVNEFFEFRFIPEFITQNSRLGKISGLTPIIVGFKAKLAEEKGIFPQTAFIGHMATTLASAKLKTSFFAPAFRFTFQHTLSEKIALGYNLGMEWDGETAQPFYIYTLTFGFSLSEKIGCYAEGYGFLSRYTRRDHRVDGGFTYLLLNNLQLDLSAGIGITPSSPDFYVAAGISFRLKN